MASKRDKSIKKLDMAKAEIKRRKEKSAMMGYQPRSFHWKFISGEEKIKLFIGSNQSGKTTSVCQEIFAYSQGFRPWVRPFYETVKANPEKYPWIEDPEEILEHERTKFIPPVTIMVCGLDFNSAIAKVIAPKLLSIIPGPHEKGPYIKKIEKIQGKVPSKIIFQNGSTVDFFSGEQDTFRFEGVTAHLAVFDEPPEQAKWVAVKRGLIVNGGITLFSMTPLSEPWIFDTLLEDAKAEGEDVLVASCNLFDPEVDWMSEKDKEDFKREVERKDPREVQARIYGKFTHLLGRVFPTFNEDIHVVDPSLRPLNDGDTYGVTVDPADRKPWMIVWWKVDKAGEVHFIDEWPNVPFTSMKTSENTLDDYVALIKEREEKLGIKVMFRFLDPNFGPKHSVLTGTRLVDELAKRGLYFDTKITDRIDFGHDMVRDYLDYDPDKEMPPKITVSTKCWNVINSFLKYTWKEKRKDDGTVSEVPEERFKDPMDCVRYTVVKEPVNIPITGGNIVSPDPKRMRPFGL